MNKQEVVFIINPNAGKGCEGFEKEILITSQKYNYFPIIEFTKAKYHAKAIVLDYLAKGSKHFVAIGGDGTVNEIASVLIHSGAKLSIIPLGSGNGLARMLEIPLNKTLALEKVFNHTIKKIDNGFVNNHPFFCTTGLGYDAYCADLYDKKKHNRGFLNYIKIVLFSLFRFKCFDVIFNDQSYNTFSLTFGNANQFGNNAYITPDAVIDDGFLDVTIINAHPKYYDLYLGYLLLTKKIQTSRYVQYFRGNQFEIKCEAPIVMHIDGEPLQLESNTASIKINPKSLIVTI